MDTSCERRLQSSLGHGREPRGDYVGTPAATGFQLAHDNSDDKRAFLSNGKTDAKALP